MIASFQSHLDLRIVTDDRDQSNRLPVDPARWIRQGAERPGAIPAAIAGLERQPPLLTVATLQIGQHSTSTVIVNRF
jgi:hypothetical protein